MRKLGFRLTRFVGPVEGRVGDVTGWLYESIDDPTGVTARHVASASEVMLWMLLERSEHTCQSEG